MAWAETRNGKLSGRWLGRVRIERNGKKLEFGPKAFDTKAAAEFYETICRSTGQEPPQYAEEAKDVLTFAQVADECEKAGGPRRKGGARKWKAGRDVSVVSRLRFIANLDWFGSKPVTEISEDTLEELREKLAVRPGYQGRDGLSPATLNRYMDAASAALTFALQQKYIGTKPLTPKEDEDNEKIVWFTEPEEQAIVNYMLGKGWPMTLSPFVCSLRRACAGASSRPLSRGRWMRTGCASGGPRPIVHDLHLSRLRRRVFCRPLDPARGDVFEIDCKFVH